MRGGAIEAKDKDENPAQHPSEVLWMQRQTLQEHSSLPRLTQFDTLTNSQVQPDKTVDVRPQHQT
eukprot:5387311-Amphidinium_carterae.1